MSDCPERRILRRLLAGTTDSFVFTDEFGTRLFVDTSVELDPVELGVVRQLLDERAQVDVLPREVTQARPVAP